MSSADGPTPASVVKVRYMSDLHREFVKYKPHFVESVGEDLVVLAGDIGTGLGGIEWASRAFAGRSVIYVLGNHEYYRNDWKTLVDSARRHAAGSNVHVLENQAVTIHGLRILGCSLWTDFALLGGGLMGLADAMRECQTVMTDYHLIRNGPGLRLSPGDTLTRHDESRAWLAAEIAAAREKVLVVTHHSPTPNNRHPGFPLDRVTTAFNSDLHALMDGRRIHAWICGHTHYSVIVQAGHDEHPVTVYSNQCGYPGEGVPFSWDSCLEITLTHDAPRISRDR